MPYYCYKAYGKIGICNRMFGTSLESFPKIAIGISRSEYTILGNTSVGGMESEGLHGTSEGSSLGDDNWICSEIVA